MSVDWKPNIQTGANDQEAADLCAAFILEALTSVLGTQPAATLAISGGSTPKLLFRRMAAEKFDWSKVHFFFVDERCVPPTDSQSNFKLADDALFTPAHISKYNIHRVHGEMSPAEGAARYVEELRQFFSLTGSELPRFDVIHRGIGPDAHTASLFPGEPLIADRAGLAANVWVEKLRSHRVTLLPGVLLKAAKTVVLAAGPDKAGPIHSVLYGPEDPFQFPCQLATRGSSDAVWFVDRAAAANL